MYNIIHINKNKLKSLLTFVPESKHQYIINAVKKTKHANNKDYCTWYLLDSSYYNFFDPICY